MSRRAKKNAARAVLGAVLLAMALFALLPFVYMGLVSLTQKTVLDLRFDPAEFSFKNYARVFSNFNIGRNLLNSVIVTGGACVLNCIVCAMAAYGFAKKHFPGRDQLFMVYLATLMIPGQVTLIPVFTIIKNLGLMNTHIALMLPILNAFGVFLVRQFMVNVPDELIEAARIDGANPVQMFFRIKLPYLLSVQGPSLVTDFVKNVNNFNVIYLLTQDVFVTNNQQLAQSNAKEIDLLVTWLFRLTQDYYNYKMAAVLGIMVFIVCAVFTVVCFHFINKKEATFS